MTAIENEAWAEYGGRLYYIDRPKLGIDLSYRFDTEARQGPFLDTENTTHVLSERFDLETEGWIYHPAMVIFTLKLSPEWQQAIDQPDPGREQTNDSFLLGYGLDLTLMPYKPYTVNLFARKQRSVLTTSLATQTESMSDTYGATLNLKYRVLPTTLAYAHSTTDQTGFYDSLENRDEVRLNMRHERKSNDTNLNASYTTLDRTSVGTAIHTENLFGSVQNNYRITPDNRILLNSNLSYRWSESDLFSASGISLSENLNWRHTKRFSTNYNFNYSQDAIEDTAQSTSINRTSIGAGLSHSLYENLITTASVNASSSSQGESAYGGNLNFNYQRRIPWGTIYASMGQDYRVTKRSIGGVFIQVLDEKASLDISQCTNFLVNRNVNLAALLLVTNADPNSPNFIIPYTVNQDYTVDVIGTSVRICRNPLGNMPNPPQDLLVDYEYLSNPAFDDATYSQSYGIGLYLWSAWRINYRYSHSQQDFLGGIPPDVLNEFSSHTVDSDLQWKWSTTRLLYEDTESTSGISLNRWRIEENLTFRPSDTTFLGASAYYGQTTLKEADAQDSFYGFRADLQWLLSGSSKVRVEGLYGVMEGTSVSTVDKGVSALWEWSYGVWRADVAYRYLNQEDLNNSQSRDRHSIFFTIRRALF